VTLGEAIAAWMGWVVALSLVTFVSYGWDKWRARRGGWRTSERTLHLLELLGGFPGGFAARWAWRHKRRKPGFVRVSFLVAVVHLAAVAMLFRLLR